MALTILQEIAGAMAADSFIYQQTLRTDSGIGTGLSSYAGSSVEWLRPSERTEVGRRLYLGLIEQAAETTLPRHARWRGRFDLLDARPRMT
jgi:hypothetical protein